MKNTIINTISEYKNHTIILIFGILTAVILSLSVENSNYNYDLKEKDRKMGEIERSYKIFAEANKRTKIEIIKEQIEEGNEDKEFFKEKRIQAEKNEKANIWFVRCLEIEGQLELKGENSNGEKLMCQKYYYGALGYQEQDYLNLEKFSSYNLENTKIELGL